MMRGTVSQLEALESRLVPATLLTPGLPSGTVADGESLNIFGLSDDGSVILFSSQANNLVAGVTDGNGQTDLFWRDLTTGTTLLVTGKPGNVAVGFDDSHRGNAVLSADGRFVAFVSTTSAATLLGNGALQDQANTPDVFRWSSATKTIDLVSVQNNDGGIKTAAGFTGSATAPNISADGSKVSYLSAVSNANLTNQILFDAAATPDLFVRDLTVSNSGGAGTIPVSRSTVLPGNMVGFSGPVSVSSPGPYMNSSGNVFVYSTPVEAGFLVPFAIDTPTASGTDDVFIRDLTRPVTDGTRLVSVANTPEFKAIGHLPNQEANEAILSADGSAVVFLSNAPGGSPSKELVAGYQANGAPVGLYLRRMPFGTAETLLVSARNGSLNQNGTNGVITPNQYRVSSSGAVVLFTSDAADLVGGSRDRNGGQSDAFVRDFSGSSPVTELVSVGNDGKSGIAAALGTGLSNDGRFVVFETASADLMTNSIDANGVSDVFVHDRASDTTEAASTEPGGRVAGNGPSRGGTISGFGNRIVFASRATNLADRATSAAIFDLFGSVFPFPSPLGITNRLSLSGPPNGAVEVYSFSDQFNLELDQQLTPFPEIAGAPRTAVGDIDGDGVADLVAGVGPGGGSLLRVISGATGQDLIAPMAIYEDTFLGGIFVATGDLNADGKAEIFVSPDQGGGGRIVGLRFENGSLVRFADYFGIEDPNFRGGARITLGDLDGDGTPDVVVAAGFGGGPRIALFDGADVFAFGNARLPMKLIGDFFAFEETLRNGAFVGAGDFNADGKADLAFGGGPGGAPRVFTLSGALVLTDPEVAKGQPIANFFAGPSNLRGGIHPIARDIDGDAFADLVTGSGDGLPGEVRTYLGRNFPATGGGEPPLQESLTVFTGSGPLVGGVFVG